jgi:hypothetical protein
MSVMASEICQPSEKQNGRGINRQHKGLDGGYAMPTRNEWVMPPRNAGPQCSADVPDATMFDTQMILEAAGNQHLSFDLSVQPPMAN